MTSRTKLLLLTALITLLEVVEIKTKQKEFALGPGPKSKEPIVNNNRAKLTLKYYYFRADVFSLKYCGFNAGDHCSFCLHVLHDIKSVCIEVDLCERLFLDDFL